MQAVPATALRFLRTPATYGVAEGELKCLETHMSWVFIAGDLVLKLKKPLRTRYLDHSTLALREHDCREELRLNRRLAPEVYLGLTALVRTAGGYRLLPEEEARPGEAIDWLVRMRCLPDALRLDLRIARHQVDTPEIDALGSHLARFYAGQPRAPVDGSGYLRRFEREHRLDREVLEDPRWSTPAMRRSLDAYEAALAAQSQALAGRAEAGLIVDGHGDLRPEHVFMSTPPVVIDALEFDAALRAVDPYDELGFLGLECDIAGAPWIGVRLHARLEALRGAAPEPPLMRLYLAGRALLRARLALAHLLDRQPRDPDKWPPLAERYVRRASALLAAPPPHAWP
jgi:aminoglycoside phosphotransferase family enzyme